MNSDGERTIFGVIFQLAPRLLWFYTNQNSRSIKQKVVPNLDWQYIFFIMDGKGCPPLPSPLDHPRQGIQKKNLPLEIQSNVQRAYSPTNRKKLTTPEQCGTYLTMYCYWDHNFWLNFDTKIALYWTILLYILIKLYQTCTQI